MREAFLILPAHNRSPKASKRLRHALCRLQYGDSVYSFACEYIGPPVDHFRPKSVTFDRVPRLRAYPCGHYRYF